RVMFVGEGPGFNEDRQGRPFVGAAGQFLNELLDSIGLRREEVYITNMVKCRPPNNRDPFPGEIAACSGYLDEQIEAIGPDIIVPLGRHALARWFPKETISKLRGMPKRFGDVTVLPLYHPAAALHNGGMRPAIVNDFRKIGELLAGVGVPPPAAAEPQPAASLLDQPPSPASTPGERPAPVVPQERSETQQLHLL
ncbi:MAG: uracil-DNA glycosylase, partial [Chloroflexota bacterium]|nr:uracil-DNA glycosylase [Chloroflexota bacterium]